jgi:agmatinase
MTVPGIFFLPVISPQESNIVVVGLPWDGTETGRPGARFGPQAIRSATLGIEDYSPYQSRDVSDLRIHDAGNIELPFGDTEVCLGCIREKCSEILNMGKRLIALGGEHLVSWPLVSLMYERYGDNLFVIQLDAHADLREEYLGVRLSHATVMNLITNLIGIENSAVIGVHSGTKDEWNILQSHPNFFGIGTGQSLDDIGPFAARELKNRSVYITIDLDVFDPGIMPGTGTPEPGGLTFKEFIRIIQSLSGITVVGADIVELAPDYDHTGISEYLAGTVLRELLLVMGASI